MYWLEVSVLTDGEAAEAVAEALRPLAHNDGVVLEQLGDARALDPWALEPDVRVKIYVPGDEDSEALRQRVREILYYLGRLYPIPEPQFRKLEDKDWAHAWKEHYRPFRVGRRLWIQPSWISPEKSKAGAEDIVLTLDPGMAFGTGLHPTTQMCLQALEKQMQPGMSVLDVGTGSGILSVAAAKLGAAKVLAVDTDREAVRATEMNAAGNGVEEVVTVQEGSLGDAPGDEWDMVVVNILAPVIVSMLREQGLLDYVAADHGRLLLSGIIDQQLPDVEAALREAGGVVLERLSVRDWVTLVGGRRGEEL